MKKFIALLISVITLCFCCVACNNQNGANDNNLTSDEPNNPSSEDVSDILIVYFSCTNTTETILKRGDITYTATDYGEFEKVGNIGHTLPQNNTQITAQSGDVILYQGRSICLYYDTNSWDFTRIGKINGYSASEMRSLLGAGSGSVQVTISLH